MEQPEKRVSAVAFAIVFGIVCVVGNSSALADHGSLGFGIGTASPIITQTGITLPTGMWAAGLITQFTDFDSASAARLLDVKNNAVDDAHGDVHSVTSMVQPSVFAAYGITDNFTLGVRLPYVQRFGVRSPNEDGNAVNNLGDPGGFGGVSVFSQYRFFHTADQLNHLSLVVALRTPSGMTHVKTRQGERFETHHQPSAGAWSPSMGFSFTRAMGKFSFDSSVLYTVATGGSQKTDIGDIFDYNIALSYAIVGVARNNLFVDTNAAPWTLVLELNGMWQDKQKVAGSIDPNTGGNTVFISPGIRYAGGRNWNTALSVGTPIVKDLNGFQTPPDYRITYRLVFSF